MNGSSSKLVGRFRCGNKASKTHGASGTIEGRHDDLTGGVVDLLLVLVVMRLLGSKVVVHRDGRSIGVNHGVGVSHVLVDGRVVVDRDGRHVGVDHGLLSNKMVIDRRCGLVGVRYGLAWGERGDNWVQSCSLSRSRSKKGSVYAN